jgi:hypothetical protein
MPHGFRRHVTKRALRLAVVLKRLGRSNAGQEAASSDEQPRRKHIWEKTEPAFGSNTWRLRQSDGRYSCKRRAANVQRQIDAGREAARRLQIEAAE